VNEKTKEFTTEAPFTVLNSGKQS